MVNIIADIWGGMPRMAHSGAARAGMLSFPGTAACEWAHAAVPVNAVAPGWIVSSGFDTYTPKAQKEMHDWKKKVPLQRFDTEAEISAAIVFLLSEAASFITGSCMRIDGDMPNARHTWALIPHQRAKPFEGFPLAARPESQTVQDE